MSLHNLVTTEHGKIELPDDLAESKDVFSKLLAVTLAKDGKESKRFLGIDGNFNASYYVGASWLQMPKNGDDGIAIQVLPKEPDGKKIDFLRMFAIALDVSSAEEVEYFSDYYHINPNACPIDLPNEA